MRKKKTSERFMSSVTVGPKGQIVIPKEVRDMFGIQPGTRLLLLADSNRGIAIREEFAMMKIADAIFSGKRNDRGKDDLEDAERFAEEIRRCVNEGDENA